MQQQCEYGKMRIKTQVEIIFYSSFKHKTLQTFEVSRKMAKIAPMSSTVRNDSD